MKVLVVDAEIEVRDQLLVGLRAFEGFEVECAEGVVALDRLRRCDYDGLFLGMDGGNLSALERITDEHDELPLILLGKESVLRRAKQAHPSVFASLDLPLDAVEFFRVVARLQQRLSPTG